MTREETLRILQEREGLAVTVKPNGSLDFTDLDICLCDLRELDLIGADFGGTVATDADLRGANLAGALFTGADLRDSDLRGATLDGANFDGANIWGVTGLPEEVQVNFLDRLRESWQ